jgi:hypothetical protein
VSGRHLVIALFRRGIDETGRMERAYRHRQVLAGTTKSALQFSVSSPAKPRQAARRHQLHVNEPAEQ